MLKVIREHARLFYQLNEQDQVRIGISKLDVALDYKGSFLPY